MSPDQDLTVKQIVSDVKPVLAAAKPELDKIKTTIDKIITSFEDSNSGIEGQSLAVRARAIKLGVDNGIITVEEATDAVAKLLKQFSLPLAIAGGVKIQGSGELAEVGASAYKGIQTAMTEAQKAIAIAIPIIQCTVIVAGTIISFFPNIGLYGLGGGLTISKLIGIAGAYLNVKNSTYSDAPRAQLVKLPS